MHENSTNISLQNCFNVKAYGNALDFYKPAQVEGFQI